MFYVIIYTIICNYKIMTIKLKDLYLFEWIKENLLHFIIDNSRRVEYTKSDYVLHQWQDSDNNAYIIQSWIAKIEIDWEEIWILQEWNIFWEIALITNEKRTASIKAETDLVLLKISKELLHKIIKEFKNGKEIQKELIRRIKENAKKSA
jgi:CRP-like cAMP-binding protein